MITVQRGNPAQGKSTPKGIQFLNLGHIGATATVAKITEVTTDEPDNYGNPVVVYFEFGGTDYSKGFKPTSDGLIALVDLLGADETKWVGKSVKIGKKADKRGGERLTYSKA
jgi:hypothetical protein